MAKHWIYVLGKSDLRRQADDWQVKMGVWDKEYDVIKPRTDEAPNGKLSKVGNDDILYLYTHMWVKDGYPLNRVGESQKTPKQTAELLYLEDLDDGHKILKVFSCRSGEPTATGGVCFARALYDHMVGKFPSIRICGYKGETSPAGIGRHKSANLTHNDSVPMMSKEEWDERGLRAKNHQVWILDLILSAVGGGAVVPWG